MAATISIPPVNLHARIQAALVHQLSPQDLSRSPVGLVHKLQAIGGGTGLFTFPVGDGRERKAILRKVSGASREWTIIANIEDEHDMISCAGFWIGARGSKVVASILPQPPESLEGPLNGQWRRVGKRLIGVGISVAFHSPTFIDGHILIFAEEPKGLKLLKDIRVDESRQPPSFRSKTSNDILSRVEAWNSMTIQGHRHSALTKEQLWRLKGGTFLTVRSRIVHDESWALDRFATAVRQHQWTVVREMAPNTLVRRFAVREIKRALKLGQIYVNGYSPTSLESKNLDESRFEITFSIRNGRWIVDRVRI